MASKFKFMVLLLALLANSSCASTPVSTTPALVLDKTLLTFDGLYSAQSDTFDQVYVRDPLDLSAYQKIMPLSATSQFRYVPPTGSDSSQIIIRPEHRARFQAQLAQTAAEDLAFGDKLVITDQVGADVLTFWGTLVDINAYRTEEQDVGEFILVLELRDSLSEDTLVRVIDKYRVPLTHGDAQTNWQTLELALERIAAIIKTRMDQLLDGM